MAQAGGFKMSTFTFKASFEREDHEQHVKVLAEVESYAAAVGFPDEPCARREVTILEVETDGPALSDDEMNELTERAYDQLRYC